MPIRYGTLQTVILSMTLTGTVAALDVVQLDLSASGAARFESVKKAAAVATVGNALACGVALKAGVAGDIVPVQFQGFLGSVPSAGVTAEQPVCVIGTAGTLVPCVAASTAPQLAFAVTTTASNVSDIFLTNPLRIGV